MSGPSPSAERLQRLLAMVPWVAAQDGPTLSTRSAPGSTSPQPSWPPTSRSSGWSGCRRTRPTPWSTSSRRAIGCGSTTPRCSPRPHRLTPDQAVALLTAGASVLALPGADPTGPLARAWPSWPTSSASMPTRCSTSTSGRRRPTSSRSSRPGIDEGRQVHLDYYSYGRDTRTERDVDPYVLQAQDGALYLLGHCHRAGDQRRFRVDRIAAADPARRRRRAARRAALHRGLPGRRRRPPGGARAAAARGVGPRRVPGRGGRGARRTASSRVTLAVAAAPWLERLLIGLGPAAKVVEGPPELAAGAARAAARILARYRDRP